MIFASSVKIHKVLMAGLQTYEDVYKYAEGALGERLAKQIIENGLMDFSIEDIPLEDYRRVKGTVAVMPAKEYEELIEENKALRRLLTYKAAKEEGEGV